MIEAKGRSQTMTGVVVGMFGAGSVLGAVCGPLMLRWIPPLTIIKSTTLGQSLTTALFGLSTLLDGGVCVAFMCVARFGYGFINNVNQISTQAIAYRMGNAANCIGPHLSSLALTALT